MARIIYKELSYTIVGAAMNVHKELGPGFLESVYQKALALEFNLMGFHFEEQVRLPVTYRGVLIGDFVADYVVERQIVVEIKAASHIHPRHKSQALNYLAASGLKLAIVINFGEKSLTRQRVVR